MAALMCSIWRAANSAQFGVAQQSPHFRLHFFVELVQLLPNRAEFAARHIEHMSAAIDAPGDRLRHRSEVFDSREQLNQTIEPFVEPHPVAIDRPRANQRVGDFQKLLGTECRADRRTASEQSHSV